MTSLLFFDFDGCLFDTAYECAVVAWCVRHDIERGFGAVMVDQEFLENFYNVKPYVRYAREYVIFSSDAYRSVEDEESLARALAASVTPQELVAYERRFYATREAMKAESFEAWLRLNPPYPFAVEALRAVTDRAVIVSAKDRKTIVEVLGAVGVAPLGVYDYSYAPSKRATLERLRREAGLRLGGAVFLDDNVDHLIEVQAAGVRPVLASWGYVSTGQMARAKEIGIPIATADTLWALLDLNCRYGRA